MKRHTALFAAVTLVVGAVMTFFLPVKLDHEGREFIKKHEAFSPTAYRDQGGVWTIGYGFTYYPDLSPVRQGDYMTKTEADYYFEKLVRGYEWTVHDLVDVSLSQSQYNALVSFCYNVGQDAFERSNVLRMVNENPVNPHIQNAFLRWVYVKGKVSRGLIYRRKKEVELYFKDPMIFEEGKPMVSYFKPDASSS
jgi:lysozyme